MTTPPPSLSDARSLCSCSASGHSWKHNILNPTWPTEWRQTTPLMAIADYLATGELDLYAQFAQPLEKQTQVGLGP